MDIEDVMKGPRLKMRGAYRHIAIGTRDAKVLPSNFYEVRNGSSRSKAVLAKPDVYTLSFIPRESIPEYFSSVFGDALTNMRSALDFWMNAAVQCVGPRTHLYFPITSRWKDLKGSKNFKAVQKAFPDAASFIHDVVKPCEDTNVFLGGMSRLRNDHNHNDFISVAVESETRVPLMTIGGNRFYGTGTTWDAATARDFVTSVLPIEMDDNLTFTADLRFASGGPFEGQHVIPVMNRIASTVDKTLDQLEQFISAYCR